MIIREEAPNDVGAIRDVVDTAFPSQRESILIDVLRARKQVVLSLVAEVGGQVVGHVFFTPLTIEASPGECRVAALAPLCVLPSFQKEGIGSKLVTKGIEQCRVKGYEILAVLGDPAFYGRFGFVRAIDHGIRNEYDADDSFMVLACNHASLSGCSGLAKYRPEFRIIGV